MSLCQSDVATVALSVRLPNAHYRSREFLTPEEVEQLLQVARKYGRYKHRHYTLLLVMYRHGLRVSEAINLRWDDVDFGASRLYVRRRKHGTLSLQPIEGDELRALRQLQRETPGPFVFVSERNAPLTTVAVRKLMERIGQATGFPWKVHPLTCIKNPSHTAD